MVEVKIDFNEVNVVPVGIKHVEVDGVKLKFISNTNQTINRKNSSIVINNTTSTSLQASDREVDIHIVSVYKDLDTHKDVTIHERTIGCIREINSNVSQMDMTTFEIVIDSLSPIEYTMETKTRDEEINDEFAKMLDLVVKNKISLEEQILSERKSHKKDMDELIAKLEKQEKEFKEFKDRIHKAFGVGELFIGSNGISSGFTITASNSR